MDISQFFYNVDAKVVAFGLVFSIMLCAHGAFLFGRWMRRKRELVADPSFSVVQGGVLGLVALILGFSFSLAGGRFDARQSAVMNENNAIGTTYLRSSFLEIPDQRPFRILIRQYAQLRLDRYAGYASAALRRETSERTVDLQGKIWRIVVTTGKRIPSQNTLMLTQATNAMFDSGGTLDASLENHVPGAIVLLVIISSLAGAVLIGLGFGIGGTSHMAVSLVYAIVVALLVTTTLDLDRPSKGWIQLHLSPFSDQLRFMERVR